MPHDVNAFTQGLVWSEGRLFESTGLYGQSSLRELNPATGDTLRTHVLPPKYFAEGLASYRGELIQLTWKENTAFRFPVNHWNRASQFTYAGEGWGLTTLENGLWMSNGSDTLFHRDKSFRTVGTVSVRLSYSPVTHLNELEGVGKSILANIWYSDSLVVIDPESGCVRAVVDASALVSRSQRRSADNVLNGIAYNAKEKVFYLTGKNWPLMFKVRLPFAY